MLFTDVIRAKRDGGSLTPEQLEFFAAGLADESIPAEQVSALAMAIFLNGFSRDEAAKLTREMSQSGVVLDWSGENLNGPVVDKHSTGGVGDKVSFMLAPIAAACGCYVPMISGRGLGHTGGTTDKAESIPGYQATPDFDTFRRVVKEVGCAVIGQTADLAPADRRFYAIRDVTSTVESIPLITCSILSKKIAAGLDALVMDVKFGTGAFMDTSDRARELADSLVDIAAGAGLPTHALLTDMNQVLGLTVGNSLELRESIDYLMDMHRDARLDDIILGLCGEMLVVSGLETDRDAARVRCDEAVTSGKAAEIFAKMVTELGGPADLMENPDKHFPAAPVIRPVHAHGVLQALDVRAVGNAIIHLGGGRQRVGEALDHRVGLTEFAPLGTPLDGNRPLALIHAANEAAAEQAERDLLAAAQIGSESGIAGSNILEILS
ncbi:MAG: thymidine phosphorylase [Pseudomonadota bacterium]